MTVPLALPMRGGLMLLVCMTAALTVLAAYGLRQFRVRYRGATGAELLAVRLQHDLVMAVGMTSVGWMTTCIALLVNPTLGAETLGLTGETIGLYSISRGCMMLVFWQCVALTAFLLRQVRAVPRDAAAAEEARIAC